MLILEVQYCSKKLRPCCDICFVYDSYNNYIIVCHFLCEVRRVLNTWGPQTRGIDPGSMGCTNPQDPVSTLFKQDVNDESSKCLEDVKPDVKDGMTGPVGLEERLNNAECHLKMHGPMPRDIYSRLKQIENRILHLEGLSPEYFQFWVNLNFSLFPLVVYIGPKFKEWLV